MKKLVLTDQERERIFQEAMNLLGTPYCLNGDGIQTFNCSQFVVTVLKNALDIRLPAKVDWLFIVSAVKRPERLEKGDLVFFCRQPRPKARIATHVALYIEDGKIIHARQKAGKVAIESISDFSETMITEKNLDLLHEWLEETYLFGES